MRHQLADTDTIDAYNPQRWRRLADLCIAQGNIDLALQCARHAEDFSLSLLLITSTGNRAALAGLAEEAEAAGQLNIAFLSLYLLGETEAILAFLQRIGRLPEAAFFALSHIPSHAPAALEAWRKALQEEHHIAAELLADPQVYSECFPGLEEALQLEKALQPLGKRNVVASDYPLYRDMVKGNGVDLSQLHCLDSSCEEDPTEFDEILEGDASLSGGELNIDDLEKEWGELTV